MSYQASDEVKEVYRGAHVEHYPGSPVDERILADALVDVLAALREAEFDLEEGEYGECVGHLESDPRHDWMPAQWKEAARKELEEANTAKPKTRNTPATTGVLESPIWRRR